MLLICAAAVSTGLNAAAASGASATIEWNKITRTETELAINYVVWIPCQETLKGKIKRQHAIFLKNPTIYPANYPTKLYRERYINEKGQEEPEIKFNQKQIVAGALQLESNYEKQEQLRSRSAASQFAISQSLTKRKKHKTNHIRTRNN